MHNSYNLSSMVLTSLTFKLKLAYHSTWTTSTHVYQKKNQIQNFHIEIIIFDKYFKRFSDPPSWNFVLWKKNSILKFSNF
jgi:hypothetical protein